MKKVLFLIHTLSSGGAEKVLIDILKNIDKEKYDVTVMTVINTGILIDSIPEDVRYKTIIKIPKSNKKNTSNKSGGLLDNAGFLKMFLYKLYSCFWKYIPAKFVYEKFIKKDDYDVEVAFLEGISSKIISASTNKKSKKYCWIHVDLLNERKSELFFKGRIDEKNNYSKFDKIFCVSKMVRDSFITKFSFDQNKVETKYNPVSDKEILLKSKEKCTEIEPNSEIITISAFGRLASQKRFDRLIQITKKLVYEDQLNNFHIYIFGEGPERKNLEELIIDNKVSHNISLMGFTDNPYKYMANSDFIVSSSYAEGFSTVITESSILGLPAVVTNCSGMKEILGENNEYGIVTDNDTNSLYIGIKEMILNTSMRKHYQEISVENASRFNFDNNISAIEMILDE